jgi:predicted aspartyl protease
MTGFKRRTRVEGWALDVSDGEEVGYRSTIQKLGDNNRLWIAALIVLVVVSAFLLKQTKSNAGAVEKPKGPPPAQTNGAYLDQDHKDFARQFVRDKGKDGQVVEAKFVNDRKFMFVVPGDTGADDIEYLSKMAAELHRARFKSWLTIDAYQRSAANGRDILRARTTWVKKQYGFVVKFVEHEE